LNFSSLELPVEIYPTISTHELNHSFELNLEQIISTKAENPTNP